MQLTIEDCDSLLAEALPAYGVGPDVRTRLLSLSENGTYLVTDGDRRFVVRVHRYGYQDAESIASELTWTDALRADCGVSTPAVVPTIAGAPIVRLPRPEGERHVVAFTLVDGETGEDSPHPISAHDLGELTARMHRQVEGWTPPSRFRRFHWDADACLGPDARWGSWKGAPGVTPADHPTLAAATERILGNLAAYGRGPDRYGLVHADLRLANLMIDDELNLTVIDFDDCGYGWFLYDLATVVSWLEHTDAVAATIDEWIAGYTSVRALSADDLAMVPTFVMLRRLMLTAWLGTHPQSPPAVELGTGYGAGTVELAHRFLTDPTWLRPAAAAHRE